MKFHFLLGSLGVACLLLSASTTNAGSVGEEPTYNADYASYSTEETTSFVSPGLEFKPTQFDYNLSAPMRFTQGGGHATVQNFAFFANLITPDRQKKFSFGLDFFARYTRFSAKGNDLLNSADLYMAGVNTNFLFSLNSENSTHIFAGAAAMISTDGYSVTSDAFQFSGRVGLSHRFSDKFSLQGGIYYSPQLSDYSLLPVILFRYVLNDAWTLQLDPLRLRLLNTMSTTFSWGPFLGINAGSWNVKEFGRHRRLSAFSAVGGVQANYVLGSNPKDSPTLTTELGFTFANRFSYYKSNGRDEIMGHNADPGFFLRTGIKIEF